MSSANMRKTQNSTEMIEWKNRFTVEYLIIETVLLLLLLLWMPR